MALAEVQKSDLRMKIIGLALLFSSHLDDFRSGHGALFSV